MSAIQGFSSQISGLSLNPEPLGNAPTKNSEPLVISIDPRDLGVASGGKLPQTIRVSSKQTEIQIFKKFGFDVKNEADLSKLKERLGGKDPFAYVLSDSAGYTAKLENGKYVIRTRIDTALRKELQGIAAQIQEPQNNQPSNNPNVAGAQKNGIDEAARRRAEIERKFPDIPNVPTLPPSESPLEKFERAKKMLEGVEQFIKENPPTPAMLEQAVDDLQSALDMVGIIDPTPISDGVNAVISFGRGHYGYAAISAVAAVLPYAGDLAKLGKLPKLLKSAERAVEFAKASPELAKKAESAIQQIRKQLDDVPVKDLPKQTKEALENLKKQIDEVSETQKNLPLPSKTATDKPDFVGTLKGEKVQLPGVKTQTVEYTKRLRTDAAELRKEFDQAKTGGRAMFVKDLSNTPKKVADLKAAGFTDDAIAGMQKGEVPKEWQVHHKLPLDDGGNNSFTNLVLIKNEPYHKAITNEQRKLVGDLKEGQTRTVEFPIPSGAVYPAKELK